MIKRSLLVISNSTPLIERTSIYFSREFSHLLNINSENVYDLIGNSTETDINFVIRNYIHSQLNEIDPNLDYFLYVFINGITNITSTTNTFSELIKEYIEKNGSNGSNVNVLYITDKPIDYNDNYNYYNWVSLGFSIDLIALSTLMTFIRNPNLQDLNISKFYDLLLVEMIASFAEESQYPIIKVSSEEMFKKVFF